MIRLRRIWSDPVWSKVIAGVILAVIAYISFANVVAALASAVSFLTASTPVANVVRWAAASLVVTFAGWLVWLDGRSLYRVWRARPAAFLPFRNAAALLYEKTRAADLLSGAGVTAGPDVRLGYHAYQLVHYAKFGKATLYGKKTPSTVLEPIPRNDLWTGKRADDMHSWMTEGGLEYAELSIRRRDLGRVVWLVRRAVTDHNSLAATARLRSPDDEN